MTSSADISVLYQEFTEPLTEVLAESSVAPLGEQHEGIRNRPEIRRPIGRRWHK